MNKANECCYYCHQKEISSCICLLCGSKVCNHIYCTVNNGPLKGKEYSLIYHSKKCCGGNGLFLNVRRCEIEYVLKRKIIESNIFVYMNDYGEALKEKYNLGNEYKLNKNELNKGITEYIDLTYRKNNEKIYFEKNDN